VVSTVRLLGQDATMVVTSTPTRPVNQRRLLLHLGDTTVQIIAASGGSPAPGEPDVNPLIDEATFLAVMENLRPYPE
jgi:hypothetical protein